MPSSTALNSGSFYTGSTINTALDADGNGYVSKQELLTRLIGSGFNAAEAELIAAIMMQSDTGNGAGLDITELTSAFTTISQMNLNGDTSLTLEDVKHAFLNSHNGLFQGGLSEAALNKLLVDILGACTAEEFRLLYSKFGDATTAVLFANALADRNSVSTEDLKRAVAKTLRAAQVGNLGPGSVYALLSDTVDILQSRMKISTNEAKNNTDDLGAMMRINATLNTLGNLLSLVMQQFTTYKQMSDSVSKSQ